MRDSLSAQTPLRRENGALYFNKRLFDSRDGEAPPGR